MGPHHVKGPLVRIEHTCSLLCHRVPSRKEKRSENHWSERRKEVV
jgi:hypothetical protein